MVVIRCPIRIESGSSIPLLSRIRRLVVEQIELRGAPRLEQVDHPFAPWSK